MKQKLLDMYTQKTISIDDNDFPQELKKLKDCPKKIYVMGNFKILNQDCISIVGTRKSSEYANSLATNIASKLSKNGFVIVSGLAYGIDQCAHSRNI